MDSSPRERFISLDFCCIVPSVASHHLAVAGRVIGNVSK
jgi:hypothetical protein